MEEHNHAQSLETKALSGFMELLPGEQLLFNHLLDTIRYTYEQFGFAPIDTPVIERANVLLAKAGGETEKQIYRFTKGDTDLALRFDLTVPLARYVAEHYGQLTFPFRRYAIGKVYRGERPQAGRFREFYQCDVDVIGNETLDLNFDAEMPSIIASVFQSLGFSRFTVRINNRAILNGLFAELGITDLSTSVLQSIDRLEKIGMEAVLEELRDLGISATAIEQLTAFLTIAGTTDTVLAALQALPITHASFQTGVRDLETVITNVRALGVPEENFAIDLTIARGLDYYTGTVFETRLTDHPDIGSVCSGGRYENLASQYSNKVLPGVGVSIGLTRLFDQLRKRDLLSIPESGSPTRVLVIPLETELKYSLHIAHELRQHQIATETWYGDTKLKKSLGYANKLGIPFAVLIGSDEVSQNLYTLKDLTSGEQQQLDLSTLTTALIEKLHR